MASERSAVIAYLGRGAALATVTAILGWTALAIELLWSVSASLQRGRSLAEALFLYFRYFSIQTNVGVAALMSVTAMRLMTGRRLPQASLFNAAVVYMLVTSVTYEIMLRHQWSPQGMQFLTDATIHDIMPALMLAFWLGFAPRATTGWRNVSWILSYPAGYLAMTLVAGAVGESYPYSFLDVSKLGLSTVLVIATIFLVIFYALGLGATAVSSRSTR